MWLSKQKKSLIVGIVVGAFLALPAFLSLHQSESALEMCSAPVNESDRIDCVLSLAEKTYVDKGMTQTLTLFAEAYDSFDFISDTGCHRHIHKLGDYVYYSDYVTHQDLEKIEFPTETTMCGYGFYHGFIEHLIQNQPDPGFAVESCEYLIDAHGSQVPAMADMCYHGTGHGFMLSQADALLDFDPHDIVASTLPAVERCEEMNVADEYKAECKEGVYNVYVDWVMEGDYDLAPDPEAPFDLCAPLWATAGYESCSIEIGRKIIGFADHDITIAWQLLQQQPIESVKPYIFRKFISGLVQNNPTELPVDLFLHCREYESPYAKECRHALFNGIYHHGRPGYEYVLAEELCAAKGLTPEEVDVCHARSADKSAYFYSQEKIARLCQEGALSAQTCSKF